MFRPDSLRDARERAAFHSRYKTSMIGSRCEVNKDVYMGHGRAGLLKHVDFTSLQDCSLGLLIYITSPTSTILFAASGPCHALIGGWSKETHRSTFKHQEPLTVIEFWFKTRHMGHLHFIDDNRSQVPSTTI